jgi:flagellar protein FlaH
MNDTIFKIDLEGDELHSKLGGGIPKNSVILIEAAPGIGKSILVQRFTYGALMNDVKVSYVSTELPVVGFMNQMESLKYHIRDRFLNGQLKFASIFSGMRDIQYQENLINKIIKAKKIIDSDIIIIDSLSDVLVKKDLNLADSFKLVSELKKIASKNKTVILCVEPTTVSDKLLGILRNVAEVHIEMGEKEQYGFKIYFMLVKRFNGAQGDVEKELPFKVRAGIGLVVEIQS